MSDTANVTVRRIEAERVTEFRETVDYAFNPTAGPQEYDEPLDRIGTGYGAFVGDDLVSVCVDYDLEARLRGDWIPLAGLTAVATPPEHRRQGYVSRSIEAALERWRGDFPLAALWPFDRSYYEQFGWATACKRAKYACPPEQLAFARRDCERGEGEAWTRDDDREFRRVTADDWDALQAVHEARVADHTLALRRDEAWWREKVFRVDDDDRPFAYACDRDGDLAGYAVYSFEDSGEGSPTAASPSRTSASSTTTPPSRSWASSRTTISRP